jgi:glutamate-1-semialdehyde 2,1-aminomutase
VPSSSGQSSPSVTYTESDRIIWEEDLDGFVPPRIFDAHCHLWIDDHLPSDHPRRKSMVQSTMRITEEWNERIFPYRQMDYLIVGMPVPGVDVRAHNRFIAEELKPHRNSRGHLLVTPGCRPDDIRSQIEKYGFTGLKPYRLFSVTGDINQCRIHEFLPHTQLELANELGLWITLHLSRYHGCADEANLRDLEDYTTKRYPKIKWILAHCARSFTYWPIQQAVERLRQMPNIWYDNSAVTDVLPHYTLFKQEDHRRIFFGTDNLTANSFHGHYVAMGRFWYQIETPEYAKQPNIHCDQRPVLSVYQQLLCMKHAAQFAGLSSSQVEDIFCNNARAALGLQ